MKETTVKQAIEREREVEEQGIQIQIENVSMTFKDNDGNDVQALKNINLNVKKGEFVSLVGPSGCGKTTLLRLIADLLEPSDGIVKVAGMTPREVRLQQKFEMCIRDSERTGGPAGDGGCTGRVSAPGV